MYHFIGIKGSGMASLALILHGLGFEVQGSDIDEHLFTEDEVRAAGIKILPFSADNIKEDMIIVKGNAFKDTHEEVVRAKELGLKIYSYQEMIAKLTERFETITIAGCHGKTTTTSMLSHVLKNITGCNYLIGDGTGYANKDNKYFALEACEWQRHFLAYKPYYAIITNIELDHMDYYKDISDIVDAYQEYANHAEKMIIACGDDPYTHSLEVKPPIFFYGLDDDNDIQARNVEYHNEGTSFDVFVEDNYYGHFDLPLYGKHMLLNSLAVIGVCYYERLDAREVAKYLKTFEGAKRRFKEKVIGDIVTIDDYAHHPTEVKVTIKGARQKYPDKEIVAIFLPNTYSRTEALMDEFIDVLKMADKAYIMDIHCDRERSIDYPGVSSDTLIEHVPNSEKVSLDDVDKLLKHHNSVMCFMSCTNIYVLLDKYKELLKKQ